MTTQHHTREHYDQTVRDYDQMIAVTTDRLARAEKEAANSRIALNALVTYRGQFVREWAGQPVSEATKYQEARP